MPSDPDLQRGDSVHGVIHRTGGAGEVEDVIHRAAVERLIDINLPKFKAGFVSQVIEVGKFSGEQIVGDNDGVAFGEQGIAQVRTQEPGSASYQGALLIHDFSKLLAGGIAAPAVTAGIPAGRPTL